jgi:hypothetical protein
VVHGKVSQYFAVQLNTGFVNLAHKLRIRQSVLSGSRVDP